MAGDVGKPAVAETNAVPVDAKDKMEEIEDLRRRQNEQLLQVLEEEQKAEARREELRSKAALSGERRRLDKIFGVERAKASERIMRITEDHERELAERMADLDLVEYTQQP